MNFTANTVNSTETVRQNTSLKTILDSLSETSALLETVQSKLSFAVYGDSKDTIKAETMTSEGGNATIEVIAARMYEIARQASTISKLTTSITGV
jgi:fructoselysine-6-P-deglycase FrlB-like protein